MKTISLIKYNVLTLFIAATLFACDDILDTETSVAMIERETEVLTNPYLLRAAANGLYTQNLLVNWQIRDDMTLYFGTLADDAYNIPTQFDDIKNNTYTPANGHSKTLYSDYYKSIFYSNDVLKLLDDAAGKQLIPDDEAAVYRAEAKYFRAYSFFVLTALYGDVPLVLSTDILTTSRLPREDRNTVIRQIIDDLTEAAKTLASVTDRTKVNGAAAKALLARQYLYIQDWENAEKYSDDVIKNSGAEIETDIDKVFVRSSRETIFKISTDGTWAASSYWNRTYIGTDALNANYLRFTDDLVNSFDKEKDLRFSNWIKDKGTYYQQYKYRRNTATAAGEAEDHILLRIGEQYLIRAEARAHQAGKFSLAIEDINTIRTRAGLDPLPQNLTQPQILLAVEEERRHELFVEELHRWWDITRTGRADALLGNTVNFPTKKWASYKALLPIPESEIANNPNLLPNNPEYGATE
jgi:hypothetical protein